MMTFSDLYKNDIKMRQLRTQLKYLPSLVQPKSAKINIRECFKALREQATSEDGKLICEVIALANFTPCSSIECTLIASVLLAKVSKNTFLKRLEKKKTFWGIESERLL